MNRLFKSSLVLVIVSAMVIGCTPNNNAGKTSELNVTAIEKSEPKVKIVSDKDSFYQGEMGIIFTPFLQGDTNKELQYHWILIDNQEYEGFYSPDKGQEKEIINSGRAVKLTLNAEVSYIEGAYSEFKIRLQIEEKDTGKIVAEDEITIENHAGFYKIKNNDEAKIENKRSIDLDTNRILSKVYEQFTQVEKDNFADTWTKADVYIMTLRKEMGSIIDESYIGEQVCVIDFHGSVNYMPNNKIVFASLEDYRIVGYGYID